MYLIIKKINKIKVMKAKDVFKTIIENEIDISFEIAQHWYTYQNLSVKKGYEEIAKIQFLRCVKIEIEKSLFIQKDWYLEWIEGQFENKFQILVVVVQ
jgi:hypothetical protein